MQLSELKLITASNIIRLRTGAGMTQAELGEKLNYSDKTISKWERGEAIPDAAVLLEMSDIFGVKVDDLLSSHDMWEAPVDEEEEASKPRYSVNVIIALAVLGVWTAAVSVFVALWLVDILYWQTFVIALPVSILVYMVLICVFKKTRHLQFVIAAFVLSIFVLLYVLLPLQRPWQLFIIAAPAVALVFLSCNIRTKPAKVRKNRNKNK